MIKLTAILALFSTILCCKCAPQQCLEPVQTPVIDPAVDESSDAVKQSPAGKACINLRTLHCEEGSSVGKEDSCTTSMQRTIDSHLTLVPVDCIIGAKSQREVRLCGNYVTCKGL